MPGADRGHTNQSNNTPVPRNTPSATTNAPFAQRKGRECSERCVPGRDEVTLRSIVVTYTLPMAMIEIREYNDERGRSPFRRWFGRLDNRAAARIAVALERMSEGNLGDVRSVGEGVMERRFSFGPGYRIYFGRDGETLIVLLCGGDKRRQQRDIQTARSRWAHYKQMKPEQPKP